MFNEEKNNAQVIRHSRNQSLQVIEIFYINDKSNDKKLSILKSLQKANPRMRITANKKNHIVLYNNISEALKANG